MTKTQIKRINELANTIEKETDFLVKQEKLTTLDPSVGVIRRAASSLRDLTLPPTYTPKPDAPAGSIKITSEYARAILTRQYSSTGGNVSAGLRALKDGESVTVYNGAKLIYQTGDGTRLGGSQLNGGTYFLMGSPDQLKPFI